MDCFVDEQTLRHAGEQGVDNVALPVGVLLLELGGDTVHRLKSAGQTRREGEVDERRALACPLLEALHDDRQGNLGSAGDLARAQAIVELLGLHGDTEVVKVLAVVHHEGKLQKLDARVVEHATGKVAAGVEHEPAFRVDVNSHSALLPREWGISRIA